MDPLQRPPVSVQLGWPPSGDELSLWHSHCETPNDLWHWRTTISSTSREKKNFAISHDLGHWHTTISSTSQEQNTSAIYPRSVALGAHTICSARKNCASGCENTKPTDAPGSIMNDSVRPHNGREHLAHELRLRNLHGLDPPQRAMNTTLTKKLHLWNLHGLQQLHDSQRTMTSQH